MSRKQTRKSKQLIYSQCIRLEFSSTEAREVCVAGSFNNWQPATTSMIGLGHGHWLKELALPPGRL